MGGQQGAIRACMGGLAALFLSCGPNLSPLQSRSLEAPPAQLEGVLFEGYTAGALEVRVHAARAEIDAAGLQAHLRQVRIEFDDPERGPLDIHAQRGRVDLVADDFVLSGEVEGTVGDGQHFSTSEVRYVASAQRLWTDQPVTVTSPNLVLRGDGMEIDLTARKLVIRGRVHTKLGGDG